MSLTNAIEAINTAYFDRVAKIDLDFAVPTSAATRARSRAIDAATEHRDAARLRWRRRRKTSRRWSYRSTCEHAAIRLTFKR